MNCPKVSILIMTYNHECYIEDAIQSALNQSYPNIEVLVIDDASTDQTAHVLAKFSDPRLKVLSHQINRGPSAAVNAAARAATGGFVSLLSGDDKYHPEKIEKQMNEFLRLQEPRTVLFSKMEFIGDNNETIDRLPVAQTLLEIHNQRTHAEILRHFFQNGNYLPAPTAFMPRSVFDDIGYMDIRFLQLQDFDFWVRLAIYGYHLKVLPETLVKYRIRGDGRNLSRTSNHPRARNAIESSWILKHFLRIDDPKLFQEIFPEKSIETLKKTSENGLGIRRTIDYLWARQALESDYEGHQLFGINVLEEIYRDPDLALLFAENDILQPSEFSRTITDGNPFVKLYTLIDRKDAIIRDQAERMMEKDAYITKYDPYIQKLKKLAPLKRAFNWIFHRSLDHPHPLDKPPII